MLTIKGLITTLCTAFAVPFFLSACTSLQVNHSQTIHLAANQKIVVLPFTNMTETAKADERATSMTADLLRTHGMRNVVVYPSAQPKISPIHGERTSVPTAEMLAWARSQHADYVLTGGVTEWNYKAGLDGEPAIGLNIELTDLYSGRQIWNAVGSKSGGSRTALSDVALVLINYMLSSVQFEK